MTANSVGTPDVEEAVAQLHERGYAVIENVLTAAELEELRRRTDALFAAARLGPIACCPTPVPPVSDLTRAAALGTWTSPWVNCPSRCPIAR